MMQTLLLLKDKLTRAACAMKSSVAPMQHVSPQRKQGLKGREASSGIAGAQKWALRPTWGRHTEKDALSGNRNRFFSSLLALYLGVTLARSLEGKYPTNGLTALVDTATSRSNASALTKGLGTMSGTLEPTRINAWSYKHYMLSRACEHLATLVNDHEVIY